MSFAGSTMFTRGLVPEAIAALRYALEIAVRIGDADHHLRCLRMLGVYEGLVGDHEAAIATLEAFAVVAAEHDRSALPDGETHLAINELHAGRLGHARHRLERLHQRGSLRFDDSRLARFLWDRSVDIGSGLAHAQWLTGSPEAATRTAEATVELARETKHGLSLCSALAVGACPIFFMSRRYEECARYVATLDEQVRRHGAVVWSPTARFYRAALACVRDDVPASGIDDLEQAVAELRSINHLARLSWMLGVLADALARSGHLEDAAKTIEDALDGGAHAPNDGVCPSSCGSTRPSWPPRGAWTKPRRGSSTRSRSPETLADALGSFALAAISHASGALARARPKRMSFCSRSTRLLPRVRDARSRRGRRSHRRLGSVERMSAPAVERSTLAEQSGSDENPHLSAPATRWYAVTVLCVALLLSFTDRLTINLVVDPIRRDLALSDVDVSLLQGAGFAVIFALAGLPCGLLADSVNRRNLIAAGLVLWSTATIACGLSPHFWGFLTARIAVGLGEPRWCPPRPR